MFLHPHRTDTPLNPRDVPQSRSPYGDAEQHPPHLPQPRDPGTGLLTVGPAPSGARVPEGSRPGAVGLNIRVTAGVGAGPTRLAAFDAALRSAGVGDFNLIRLSSVIPPHSLVTEVDEPEQLAGGHGDLLYCVYADAYATTPGERAWAGLAWSRRPGSSGGGLFVEHTGISRVDVERDLQLTLEELSRGRGGQFVAAGQRLATAECDGPPVCAVVMASYQSSDWRGSGG